MRHVEERGERRVISDYSFPVGGASVSLRTAAYALTHDIHGRSAQGLERAVGSGFTQDGEGCSREPECHSKRVDFVMCAALEPSRTVTHGQRAQRAGEGARTPREWPDAASSTSGGGKVWVASIGDTQTLAINAPSRSRGGGTAWLVSLLGFRCLVLFGVEALFPGQGRGAAIADICPRAQAHKMIRCISRDMATSSTPGRGTHGEDGVRVRLFVAPSTGQAPLDLVRRPP